MLKRWGVDAIQMGFVFIKPNQSSKRNVSKGQLRLMLPPASQRTYGSPRL